MKKQRINDIMNNIIFFMLFYVSYAVHRANLTLERESAGVLLCCDSDSLRRSAIVTTDKILSIRSVGI